MTQRLQSTEDYFNEVVTPNYNDFTADPTSFQKLVNCVNSLFHMHEWVYYHDKAYAANEWGQTFANEGALWKYIEGQVPEAKYVRDNANSTKHVELTRNPSTGAHFMANTASVPGAYSKDFSSDFEIGGFKVDENSQKIDLNEAVRAVYRFWAAFMQKKTGVP